MNEGDNDLGCGCMIFFFIMGWMAVERLLAAVFGESLVGSIVAALAVAGGIYAFWGWLLWLNTEPSGYDVASAEAHRRYRANVKRIRASGLDADLKEIRIREEMDELNKRLDDAME